jgi:hypothetical protein
MAVLKYYNTTTSAWEYIAASTTANFTSWKKTMAGGETSVSGTDDNAVTLSYTVGLEQVFINGVLQVRGSDYTATNGTSVTGLTALVAGDIVTVVCYAPFNVANTIAPTLVDAKGDLIAGTAADTVGRLAVGTNGQLLSAASGETTGLKWANPGMTLIKTETFSAVSSQAVNTIFSNAYTNYKVLVTINSNSLDATIFLKLRSGTTDDSSNYNYGRDAINRTGAAITSVVGNGLTTGFNLGLVDGGVVHPFFGVDLTLFNPFAARYTTLNYVGAYIDTTGNLFGSAGGGHHTLNTSWDGINLIASAGTITGAISVYGFNI